MELRQLLYFVTVAEELHFSRAAARLHMTQPPLSLQIRQLEEEMELKLFRRTKRSVALTSAGEMFYKQAVTILDKVDRARNLCRKTRLGEEGELTVGLIPIVFDLKLLGPIVRFRRRYGQVRVSLHEMGTKDQLEAVRRGRVMVGFIQTYDRGLPDLESRRVFSETYWLALPEDHELTRYKRVPIAALEGTNLILPPRAVHGGITGAIIGSCRQAGFEPRIELEVLGYHTALALAAAGQGIAQVPRTCTKKPVRGVAYRPVSAAWPKMEISMIWKADDTNPVLEQFIETMVR